MTRHREPTTKKILLVDDHQRSIETYSEYLTLTGYKVVTAENGKEALEKTQADSFDLILMDLKMPVMDGFEAIRRIREIKSLPFVPIIAVSALDKPDEVKRALELGADEFVEKPIHEEALLARINAMFRLKEAIQKATIGEEKVRSLEEENTFLKNQRNLNKLESPKAFFDIVTCSPKMHCIFRCIEKIASNLAPVLITGETGVGKELVAKVIHSISKRPGKLISINLAGVDDEHFADTLFGHVKGAFTSADRSREGLIESASSGTLFLDEIGDLGPSAQIKLLRLLQDGEYYPLGSDHPRVSDTRIIFATNCDVEELVKSGKIRQDLYYRIKIQNIHLPPLRERLEDLSLLIDHFLEKAAQKTGKKKPTAPHELTLLLSNYHFPGNIRQLENMIFEAVAHNSGGMLSMETLRNTIKIERKGRGRKLESGLDLLNLLENSGLMNGRFPSLHEVEELLVQAAMKRSEGNQKIASELLGVSRPTLCRRVKEIEKG